MGWPGGSEDKESACNLGDPDSIPGLGTSPGEGKGNSLQYYLLENSMDRGAWWATVHGVAKSLTWLSNTDTHKSILLYLFKKLLSFNILTPCLSSFKFILHNPRYTYRYILDSPGGASGKEPVCQRRRCKRLGFNPWVRKIPWRRAWQLKWLSIHNIYT